MARISPKNLIHFVENWDSPFNIANIIIKWNDHPKKFNTIHSKTLAISILFQMVFPLIYCKCLTFIALNSSEFDWTAFVNQFFTWTHFKCTKLDYWGKNKFFNWNENYQNSNSKRSQITLYCIIWWVIVFDFCDIIDWLCKCLVGVTILQFFFNNPINLLPLRQLNSTIWQLVFSFVFIFNTFSMSFSVPFTSNNHGLVLVQMQVQVEGIHKNSLLAALNPQSRQGKH